MSLSKPQSFRCTVGQPETANSDATDVGVTYVNTGIAEVLNMRIAVVDALPRLYRDFVL